MSHGEDERLLKEYVGYWFMYKTAWQLAKLTPILIAFEDCLYGPAFVRGRSMQPTLNPGDGNGNDLVLADKWSIRLYRFRRGDVVLLRCSAHALPGCPAQA